MKEEMKPVVYMLDTNILVSWADALAGDGGVRGKKTNAASRRIQRFCEENQNLIVVPDIVWVEFLAVTLHRQIDVNDDYETTLRRFRDRQTLAQQIEARMRNADNWRLDWEPDAGPFADAQELLQDPNLIDIKIFEWLKRNAENRKKKYQSDMDRLTNKILDGMDSAILVCLNDLASQEENKNRQVVLYTADFPLWRVLGRVKKLHKSWFAQNTSAVFAFFPKVLCFQIVKEKVCRHENDASILCEKEMACGNKIGKKQHFLKF